MYALTQSPSPPPQCNLLFPLPTSSDPSAVVALRSRELSAPFWYNAKHSSVLKFTEARETRALLVECAPSERRVRTVFRAYAYGDAPVLVLNCLRGQPLSVRQSGEADDDDVHLMPAQCFMKAWANPVGARQLRWSCGLSVDQVCEIDGSSCSGNKIYYN